MKDLPNKLRIKATMIELGERIAWGSEAVLMRVAADKIDALEAELALLREGQEPVVYIKCETESDKVVGTTSLNVVRVERNDDGSLTAVTDHWPAPSSPVTKTVVMPEPFPIHSNPLSDWDAGYESGYNDALSLVEGRLNGGQKK